MPDQPVPTVTLSMFWPLLMHAAGNEYNTVAHAALDRIQARTNLPLDLIYREDVAEEMAREHFPSGTTDRSAGFYALQPEGWADERDAYESFEEMTRGLADSGPLSCTDPAHVAMVIRVLAISQSLPVYIEGPNVKFKHDVGCNDEYYERGPGVWVSLWRTRPARSSDEAISVGHLFPYRPGETAENFDVGAAVFRWLAERHAEIVAATQAEDAADPEPEADSKPLSGNVLKFKP